MESRLWKNAGLRHFRWRRLCKKSGKITYLLLTASSYRNFLNTPRSVNSSQANGEHQNCKYSACNGIVRQRSMAKCLSVVFCVLCEAEFKWQNSVWQDNILTKLTLFNAVLTGSLAKALRYTPCPGKNGPPKQNAVKYTVYHTIQWHLHSII